MIACSSSLVVNALRPGSNAGVANVSAGCGEMGGDRGRHQRRGQRRWQRREGDRRRRPHRKRDRDRRRARCRRWRARRRASPAAARGSRPSPARAAGGATSRTRRAARPPAASTSVDVPTGDRIGTSSSPPRLTRLLANIAAHARARPARWFATRRKKSRAMRGSSKRGSVTAQWRWPPSWCQRSCRSQRARGTGAQCGPCAQGRP